MYVKSSSAGVFLIINNIVFQTERFLNWVRVD